MSASGNLDGPGQQRRRISDDGLQHERTALAWDRTALALLVVGALSLRGAGPPLSSLRHVPGLLAVVVGALLLWLGSRRYRQRETSVDSDHPLVRPGLVVVTGTTAFLVSLCALLLVLTS